MNSNPDLDAIEPEIDEIPEEIFPTRDPIGLTFSSGIHESDLLSFVSAPGVWPAKCAEGNRMPMPRNIYSVSPGERPILVREAVQVSANVIFVDHEVSDPFALVVAESEGRAYEIGAPIFMFD
jgi:hypothetical protein